MQLKQSLSKQFIKVIIASLLGIVIGGAVFLISNRSDINFLHFSSLTKPGLPQITVYHPSTSTIESYMERGEFQNAYDEAVKYKEAHLNDTISFKYLGLTLFQVGKYDESNQNFELALQDETLATSTKAEIYYFIGRNYDHLKEYEKALSYSQTAIQLNPTYSFAYDAVGMLMIKQGKYKEALPFFEKELSLIPDSENNPLSSYPYYYQAKAYYLEGNYSLAKDAIELAEKMAQNLPEPKPILFLQNIATLKNEIKTKLPNQ